MKKGRKIITDRETITDTEINSIKKPYNEILKSSSGSSMGPSGKSGLSSIVKLGIGSLSVLAVAAAVYFLIFKTNFNPNSTPPDAVAAISEVIKDTVKVKNERKIAPPLDIDIEYENIKLKKNNKARKITTQKGSVINIPKDAFVDADGNTVTEDITIKYRDFYNPLDFFIAGIPMDYDSAGQNYTFTSAGMFEIDAYANDKQLYLKPGKVIDIELVSNYEETYNFYYYDTIKNEWAYLKTEDQADIKKTQQEVIAEENIMEINADANFAIESELVTKTNTGTTYEDTASTSITEESIYNEQKIVDLVNKNKLKVGKAENYAFPANKELLEGTIYEGINDLDLEIQSRELATDQNFSSDLFSIIWDKISLQNTYRDPTLVLEKKSVLYQFKVEPVIEEKKYKEAKAIFDKEQEVMAQINQAYEKRANNRKARKQTVNDWAYTRNIQVINLGLYNCDRPLPKPMMAVKSKQDIFNDDGKKLTYNQINVTQKGDNTLWQYNRGTWYYSNPVKVQNIAWFVTSDKKLAIVFPESFTNNNEPLIAEVYEDNNGIDVLKKMLY